MTAAAADPTPKPRRLWAAIADTLRDEIATGHYRAGDRLPTEADLAARFGVNRHTVRHALAALAADGVVHARRGAGVFVTAAPADYPLGRRVRFHQTLAATGRIPSRQFQRLETRLADAREAEALDIAPGRAVHVVEGLSLADGVPLAAFRSVFPAERFPKLLDLLATTRSITTALAALGVPDYTRASTRLSARSAHGPLALHLRLAEGAPVLRTVAVNVDVAGCPVEYGTTWFAGDKITLTVTPE